MTKQIKKIDTDHLAIDDEAMVLIQDSFSDNFNLQNFIDELTDNEKSLKDLKEQGIFKQGWNAITGKTTNAILDSLDLNRKFMIFSIYVNKRLIENANAINKNQNELESANKKIIKNYEKITTTDDNLRTATEKFNQNSERIQRMSLDLDRLENSKKELLSKISQIKDKISTIEKNIFGKVQKFYDDTEITLRDIEEKQDSNSHRLDNLVVDIDKQNLIKESLISDINKHISNILEESHKLHQRFKWLAFSFLLFIIVIGFLFYYL